MKGNRSFRTKIAAFLVMILTLSIGVGSMDVFAKGGVGGSRGFSGGGRSFSSPSRTFSSPSRTFSSPSRSELQAAPAPRSNPGFSGMRRDGSALNPQAVAKPTVNKSTVKQSPLEQRMNVRVSSERSKESLQAYRAEQSKFKYSGTPVAASPATQRTVTQRVVVKNNYHYDPGTYAYRRSAFYGGWRAPIYGYGFYPSYGLWDTIALWYMLDHIHDAQYANMYYHHRNDADMQAWRAQAEKEAATNVELRQKLAAMDARVATLEGTPVDAGYVPADMKDVALSEQTLQKASQAQTVQAPPVQAQQHGMSLLAKVAIGMVIVVVIGAAIYILL